MNFERVTLEGRHVRLEPLTREHGEGLAEAIEDGELWKLFFTIVPPVERLDEFLGDAEADWERGDGLAFATIDKASGRVAGSTRFMRASLPDRRVEIGFTFLGKSFQRSRVNTEAKLLMLTHAFENHGLNRVEFLTDYLNQTSRNAILRLGAKQEGILRSHKVMPDGRVRDSVIFSITNYDWPGVKLHLQYKLGAN
ncbi:GNAT family N-acetyltransferase [Microbulbifer taiwanensis]|uniref:GNAT family N-acetyltransferase n=1 Tax=Microbulbifer taiwanensis TaxID=986746 RepID=A0ABW1YKG7_9GAMM|nr:GNAT family N-acetyltransferase [Microbulbifer taiwanensis]